MRKKTIFDVPLKGKRVFIRADLNVPQNAGLQITDDTRIRSTLPTINYAIDEGAKVILASHLGRPKGKRDPAYSMAAVAKRLQRLLNKDVLYLPDCVGPEVEAAVARMQPGDVILLENLRYHPEEEKNNEGFARALASVVD
ncbi:MAG: phosphoglycerate kinase, partial [Nitrospirae bacterium]|nr:phosphoglycerate kinase [Nitrospirota bacterium]